MIVTRCRVAVSSILCATLLVGCSSEGTTPPQAPSQPRIQQEIPTEAGALSSGTAPYHIETWAYDAWGTEGATAPATLVARYVTYAESIGNDKVLTDCHTVAPRCKAIRRIDTSRDYTYEDPSGIIAASRESWWLHQAPYSDFSHRLRATLGGHIAYTTNQNVPAVQSFWRSYINRQYSAYDGLMLDDMSPNIPELVYGTQATSVTELKTDLQVISMRETFARAMTRSNGSPWYIVENGVNPNPYLTRGLQRLQTPPNVHGLISEGVPVRNGVISSWYRNLLDLMWQVNGTPGFIVLLSYGRGTAANVSDRYVHTATIWLGYSPGHEVSWEDLEGGTRLNVWPEETIYPATPVQSMTTGNTNLLVQPNVWRREFRTCYMRGALWGHCAALVNTNSVAVGLRSTWLTQTYTNQIRVVGGDVQDSTAAVTLGTKPTSIPANGAVLLYGR
jgi:hypothetical protein